VVGCWSTGETILSGLPVVAECIPSTLASPICRVLLSRRFQAILFLSAF
jgi:hypothetical protein